MAISNSVRVSFDIIKFPSWCVEMDLETAGIFPKVWQNLLSLKIDFGYFPTWIPFRIKILGYCVYCVMIYIPRKHWLFKSKRYDLNNIECKLLNGDSDILC